MLQIKKYIDVNNTLKNIHAIIKKHSVEDQQLAVFDSWPLSKIFNYVKSLPYIPDPTNVPIYKYNNIELLKSPHLTIVTNGGDCDDKSILLGAIFERKNQPYRMKVVAMTEGDFHHIYPEIFYQDENYPQGMWVPFDATYPDSRPFMEKPYHHARLFDWSCGPVVITDLQQNTPLTHSSPLSCTSVNSRMLHGNTGLGGNLLATLEGNRPVPVKRSVNRVRYSDIYFPLKNYPRGSSRMMLGNLGFDFATVAAAGAAIINWIFGGGQPVPPNINTALQKLNQAEDAVYHKGDLFSSPQLKDEISAIRAQKAVMFSKYGLIPEGKAIHDVWPDIPYSQVQAEIEQKAAEFFPVMRWVHEMDSQHKWPDPEYDSPAGGKAMYEDFLSRGPIFRQFANAVGMSPNGPTSQTAGLGGNTLLILLLAGAGIFIVMSKNKKRGRT